MSGSGIEIAGAPFAGGPNFAAGPYLQNDLVQRLWRWTVKDCSRAGVIDATMTRTDQAPLSLIEIY
jgi:hypothetical protein